MVLGAFWVAIASSPAGADDQDATPDRYGIRATLDAESHVVHGTIHIRWTNRSRADVSTLLFHSYLNAFRDDQSVFARESHGGPFGRTRQRPRTSELSR